tara:strand:+ start:495 stop:1025 length:531 start_codon:yes stop_codon:yes gene_type:complete
MLIKTDDLGVPRFSNRDLTDMIYSGHVDKCHVVLCDPSDDIDKFNAAMQDQHLPELTKYIALDVDQKTFDDVCQGEWFMPQEYKDINVYEYVLGKTETPCPQHVQERIWEELHEYKNRGMAPLLRYMIYLVDFMRENNIVWGVGRGSSVASYVLYLIGVHKINSIQFDLDWREFLR